MSIILEKLYKSPTEELLTEERLRKYIENGIQLKHYIGFEISGFVHLGTGILCMSKVKDLQDIGIETTIFLADYHSWINNKLGGDLSLIRKIAKGYFAEALKKSLELIGGEPEKLKIVFGSELYEKMGLDYLDLILKISKHLSLSRVKRSLTIMGRKEGEIVNFSQLIYPVMQVADIFALGINITHGGMDQRKAHVIAIEIGEDIGGYKPIALHHHLLIGMHINEEIRQKILQAKNIGNRKMFEEGIIEIKMSKSKPEGAIFIHDSEDEIYRKIMKAYCPPKEVILNPILEILKYIIFREEREFEIENLKNKTKKTYNSYEEIEKDYILGKIHPQDLKFAVYKELVKFLSPIRRYFTEGRGKVYLEELKNLKMTR